MSHFSTYNFAILHSHVVPHFLKLSPLLNLVIVLGRQLKLEALKNFVVRILELLGEYIKVVDH